MFNTLIFIKTTLYKVVFCFALRALLNRHGLNFKRQYLKSPIYAALLVRLCYTIVLLVVMVLDEHIWLQDARAYPVTRRAYPVIY